MVYLIVLQTTCFTHVKEHPASTALAAIIHETQEWSGGDNIQKDAGVGVHHKPMAGETRF